MWPFGAGRQVPGWRKFELCGTTRLIKGKEFADHLCEPQKRSRSTGKRPDLFMRSKVYRQRTVVDFKYTVRPNASHLRQVSAYKGYPFFAQKGILVYPKDAVITEAFKAQAKARRIEIRLDAKSKKRAGVINLLLGIFVSR
jgi:hypothetical protein